MDTLQGIFLVAATIALGLMAGVFWLYAHALMPGLRRTDDRTFVGAFQAIDRAIINPQFMLTFFGALALSGVAALLQVGEDDGSVLPWAAAAFVLYLVTVVLTIAVNVPRNDALKAAGDPDDIGDLALVRREFDERRWARSNLVRAVLNTAAFACMAWALVEHGRFLEATG